MSNARFTLDPATADFVDRPLVAILATSRADGTPAQSGIWYLRDSATFWIAMSRSSVKFRHIEREPRVSLAVCGHEVPYRQVLIEGRAEIQYGGGADLFRRLSLRYYGEQAGHEYADYDENIARKDRVAVAVRVSRLRSWNFAVEDEHHQPWDLGSLPTPDPDTEVVRQGAR